MCAVFRGVVGGAVRKHADVCTTEGETPIPVIISDPMIPGSFGPVIHLSLPSRTKKKVVAIA